jgi:hypothetical protein
VAFNLEMVKTKFVDFVNTLEADLGPTVEKVKSAVGAVLGQVHAQLVADENTVKNQAIGDVQTVENAVSEQASDKPAASATDTTKKTK